MSSIPGPTLEAFLMWNYDLIVDGDGSGNLSRQLAEAIGTAPQRRREIDGDHFAKLVAIYEPYREMVEDRLSDFDEKTQSWRDYAGHGFQFLPASLWDHGSKIIAGTRL